MSSKNTYYKIIASVLTLMLCLGTVFTDQIAYGVEDPDQQPSDSIEAEPAGSTETQPENSPETEPEDAAKAEAVETSETDEAEADEEFEIEADIPDQVAEKKAESWRYEDGGFSDEVMDYNAQMGATIEEPFGVLKAAGDPGYGEKGNKSWKFKTGSGKTIECKGGYLKGIDISVWQGNINWSKVKTQVDKGNLDFVIIRCGYGSNKKANDDSKFKRNVDACKKYDIPYGVYLYSYATTKSAARSEAKHALRLLKGYYPEYPVYYDLEDASITRAAKNKSKITEFASIFCSTLANNGYKAGIYANLNWFNNHLDGTKLKKAGYDLWLAQWPASTKSYSSYGYGSKYSIWQCGSNGSVSGISTRIDTNLQVVTYEKMNRYMSDTSLPSTLTVKKADMSEGYIKTSSKARYGPGRGFKQSKSYTKGTNIQITGMANGYYRIDDGNWIHNSYVASPTDPKEVVDGYIKCYNGENLISAWADVGGARYYATRTGKVATGIFKMTKYTYAFGSTGKLLKNTEKWFGYKKYKTNSKGRVCLYKAKAKKKTYSRTGPGSNYKKKATVKKNKVIYIVRKSGSWSQMSNGYWVRTSLVKKTVKYPIYKPDTDVSFTAKLTSTYISRSGPSTSYLKKTTYKKGTEVKVTGTYGDWAKLSSGYWVPLEKLKR